MQVYPLRLVPEKTSFNFMGFKKAAYTISIVLSLISILLIAIYNFNFGIDFRGGIGIEIRATHSPDLSQMRSVLSKLNLGEVSIQHFGSAHDIAIKVAVSKDQDLTKHIENIKHALSSNFPGELEYRSINMVGPQVGKQLINSGITATLLSFLAIMAYIWLRFEWYFGLGVLTALMHDVVLSLGFMSFMQLDFNLSTIAAILTIIGYSVNDSVVIYDRIRENLRKFSKKSISEIINISVNETLSRTTLTVLTTLLASLALVIFGGEAIYSFSILVFFGIIIGTYSSIFISAPILTLFGGNNFKTIKH